MRIFGFLDQKRSKTIQKLSQNFDCYGVIKRLFDQLLGFWVTEIQVFRQTVLQLLQLLVGLATSVFGGIWF